MMQPLSRGFLNFVSILFEEYYILFFFFLNTGLCRWLLSLFFVFLVKRLYDIDNFLLVESPVIIIMLKFFFVLFCFCGSSHPILSLLILLNQHRFIYVTVACQEKSAGGDFH